MCRVVYLATSNDCVCLSVIGRSGEMINRLQSDSGARIQVAPGEE